MKTLRGVAAFFLFFSSLALAQVQPVTNGKLFGDLNANGNGFYGATYFTFGSGTATGAMAFQPAGNPTTNAEGIQLGPDVFVYRSAAGTLSITGDLVLSGTISAAGGFPLLSGNNTWTGAQAFNGAVTFTGTTTVGGPGLVFTGSGAANTRTALSLVPGTDVQAYSAALAQIAGLSPSSGAIIVGTGTSWVAQSGSTARVSLGLGTSSVLNVATAGNAAAGEVVKGDDTRLTNSRVPSGAAGGSLTGTYPNPTLSLTGAAAGTYGGATTSPTIAVSTDGRITSVSNTTIAGVAPGGSAGGSLAGTYPNPTLAAGSVTLGTTTTGSYVASVSSGTATGSITITGGTGTGSTPVFDTVQDIRTTATPTFAGLTLSGTGTTIPGATIGTSGLVFTGSGAEITRTNMGVINLPALAGPRQFVVGNSGTTAYEAATPAQAAQYLGNSPIVQSIGSNSTISGTAGIVLATNTSTSINLFLPEASTVPSGAIVNVKQSGALEGGNVTTIFPTGADVIDGGVTSLELTTQYASLMFRQSGSTAWTLLGGYGSVAPESSNTVQTLSTTGSINATSDIVLLTNTGNQTFSLPSAAAVPVGKTIMIKQTGALSAAASTISAVGSDTLDLTAAGSATLHNQFDSIVLRTSSTNAWNAIARQNSLLNAVAATSTNGIVVRTSATTAVIREVVTATSGTAFSVANGNGVAGNLTLNIPALIAQMALGEQVVSVVSGTANVDFNLGAQARLAVTENTVLTATNYVAGGTYRLVITQTGTNTQVTLPDEATTVHTMTGTDTRDVVEFTATGSPVELLLTGSAVGFDP